ncbi:MAG: tetratricopeptide repeat protein [Deltaproteobacteria bacterium]|nr:tetratricopeptide repeat protein [Deltaproteobacteria bacterium]
MELIAKKYRVLKSLGQGAMGEVFLVLPPRGEPVALKLLKTFDSGSGGGQAAVSQFENEFKVLKKLSHPNIGKIGDYGYEEEQKKVFFTSPWLKGSDLYAATRDLPFEKCEDYFVQMLRAVNYLHQKGIIHCDLKPGNIFVEDSTVLLIDFGLAGYWGESIVGTPTYLAPEVYRGEHHNVASDLYAVGVIFYNCLTRTQPFSGSSLQEVYDRHRTYTPPPISQLNPQVPKYFSDIVATLLSKKPEERYLSASAVIEEIAAYSKTKYSVETTETLLSYLPTTSELIGRKEIQRRIESVVKGYLSPQKGPPYFGIFIHGERGLGKTKFVGQIRNELQLEKVTVEEAVLPLSEAERHMLRGAGVIIIEDMENYLADPKGRNNLGDFLSFLEQKILSPETTRFLFVVSGTLEGHWAPFEKLFPKDDFEFEKVALVPFTIEETRVFLETIIGQKEIPDKFVQELYRDTEGNPGICTQIVQNLIQQGLLFDESGRWSADLLAHLEGTLQKVEVPRSLEDQMELDYSSYLPEAREIVHWLAIASHGLTSKALDRLTGFAKVQKILRAMEERRVVRTEDGKSYVLYRSAMVPFVRNKIPMPEARRRHTRLAEKDIGLLQEQVWLHQSWGEDRVLAQTALENLADLMDLEGRKEEALEHYQNLRRTFVTVPLLQRLNWAVKTSKVLIWLNRFGEAEELLTLIEKEMEGSPESIPPKNRLALWEKKGLSLLHQEKIEEAGRYFTKGLELASQSPDMRLEEVRFLNDLAEIEIITGHPEKAIPQFAKTREMMRRLSKPDLKQITNNDLGHVYHQLKDYERAIPLLKDDAKLFSNLKNHEPLARALYSLAESYRGVKKIRKAVREYKHCIEICQKENLFPILLRVYNGLGNVYLAAHDYKQALQTYQKAVDISVRLKDPATKAALLANQGLIYRDEKNWPQASRRFLLAKQILEEKERPLAYEQMLLSKCYNELAYIARQEKDNLKALSFQVELVQMVGKHDSLKHEEFETRRDLAELYLDNRLGEPFQAEIRNLERLSKTSAQKAKVDELKEKWTQIQSYDQESTQKV